MWVSSCYRYFAPLGLLNRKSHNIQILDLFNHSLNQSLNNLITNHLIIFQADKINNIAILDGKT
jgi:hypothetical protein